MAVRTRPLTQAVALERRGSLPSEAIARSCFRSVARPDGDENKKVILWTGQARERVVPAARGAGWSPVVVGEAKWGDAGADHHATCDVKSARYVAVTLPTLPAHLASFGR
jgi:hypothetical protein